VLIEKNQGASLGRAVPRRTLFSKIKNRNDNGLLMLKPDGSVPRPEVLSSKTTRAQFCPEIVFNLGIEYI